MNEKQASELWKMLKEVLTNISIDLDLPEQDYEDLECNISDLIDDMIEVD